MKKIIYSFILLWGLMCLPGCVSEEDDIFDDSSANRMTADLQKAKDILTGAKNGWLMQYYVGEEPEKYGGFNILCSFDKDGNVSVAMELELDSHDVGDIATSHYSMTADQGPILSFDTYNDILHAFSNPSSANPSGLKGEFEFILHEISDDQILLRGKKWGLNLVLTRFDEGKNWTDFLDQIIDIGEETVPYSTYRLVVDDTEVGIGGVTDPEFERLYSFTKTGGTVEDIIFSQNAIYTPTGIKFYEPIEINGKTIQDFTWDSATRTYSATDGSNVKFVYYKPATYFDYEEYLGTYELTYNNVNLVETKRTVTVEKWDANSTSEYRVIGFIPNTTLDNLPLDLKMEYSRSTGSITVESQFLRTNNSGQNINFYPMIASGNFYANNGIGEFKGNPDGQDPVNPNIVFVNNNTDNTVGFITIRTQGSSNYYLASGNDGVYRNMRMKKQ